MSFADHLASLVGGIPMTVAVTAAALAIGAVVGVPVMFLERSGTWPIRAATRFVVDIVRGVPPIVWIFLLYYGLAEDVIRLQPVVAAVVGLGLIASAYLAEVYRAGMSSVDAGQWAAGRALGMSEPRVVLDVVAPQALRIAVPPGATFALNLLKDSAIASVIGVRDLTYHASREAQQSADTLTVFVLAGLLYIVLGLPLAVASRRVDRRLGIGMRR
jgi:His/Glu/Gln/Arg/opine family amino acid ABC transporter permease subunit